MLNIDLRKKLRLIQAKKLQASDDASVNFSQVINEVLTEALKKHKI